MPAKRLILRLCAGTSLGMAVLAFLLGSASFTPALFLTVIAIPSAVVCLSFGVWRTSALAIYWGIAAIAAVPLSRTLVFRLDFVLLSLGILGLALTSALYSGYLRRKPTAR